jgi:hypothetical protein
MTHTPKTQAAVCVLRRALLEGLATLSVAALAPGGGTVRAQTHFDKTAVQYQDMPKDGKSCSRCLQFIPAAAPAQAPSCKVVAGEVGPNGYCLAFTRKPNS